MTTLSTDESTPCGTHASGRSGVQVGLLYAGLLAVLILFGSEIRHYLLATDYGMMDNEFVAWQYVHPQCKIAGENAMDFSCPLPGYNSIRMECWMAACWVRDNDSPPMTEARQYARDSSVQEDLRASLKVEPPLSPKERSDERKEQASIKAVENKSVEAQAGPHPTTLPGVLEYMRRRQELEFRWMLKHYKEGAS